jgi:hypothetical protein
VRHGNAYGLDWMVITDHGGPQHARIGVEKVNPEIVAARAEIPDTLVFQGLEWNIPAAEHGTVFVHPGRDEVAVLKEFENAFDGTVKGAGDPTSGSAPAVAGSRSAARSRCVPAPRSSCPSRSTWRPGRTGRSSCRGWPASTSSAAW